MNIIFMGTPAFAATILEALIDDGRNVVAVYTQPDRQKGRGKKLLYSEVKTVALKHHIPVVQPSHFKNQEARSELASFHADIAVVAAYGQILPQDVLDLVPQGFINIHASLLPAYRGAAPIQWALRNGDNQTGISLMKMEMGMDTGPVYATETYDIKEEDNANTLFDTLAKMGAKLLLDNIDDIYEGRTEPKSQIESEATYAPKFSVADEQINWQLSAHTLVCLNKAMGPTTGTYSFLYDKRIKFLDVFEDKETNFDFGRPGQVIGVTKEAFYIQTGDGFLGVREVQPSGKKPMSARAFLNGQHLTRDDIFT